MRLMFITPESRVPRASAWLIVCSALWMAVFGNLPLWQTVWRLPELQGAQGLLLIAGFVVMIAGLLTGMLALFAWRWTLQPVITLLLLLCALASHYMWQYGIVVDTPMLVNVLQTDVQESRDQLSLGLLWDVLLLAVLPAWWVWQRPLPNVPWPRQLLSNLTLCAAGLAVMFLSLMAVFQDFSSLMRNHLTMRYQINPLNSVYAVLDLTVIPADEVSGPLQPVGEDAQIARSAPTHKPPLFVLVLGETARSQNFSLNGYARETNPELAKLPVVSFTQVSSCGTSTAESLPCMFSHLGRKGHRKGVNRENLLDVLQRAGYAVVWIDNQSGCKGLCARIPSLRTSQWPSAEHCPKGECHDSVMLSVIEAEIAKLPAERRARGTVVVLHQMGSHGPAYYKRTPEAFKRFVPECTQTSLSQCNQQEVINAYDNTLLYTDHFLASTVAWLQRQQSHATAAMLYVSDHGESLGENNLYLHGLPYAVAPQTQTRVPLITWLSPGFEAWRGVSTACLQQGRDRALSHDHLFHSVVGLMGVTTEVYQRDLDLFAACERH